MAAPPEKRAKVVEGEIEACKPCKPITASKAYNKDDLPTLRQLYYSRLFPFDLFGRWLSYSDADMLHRREMSMTLDGDIYIRYLSYKNSMEMKADILKRNPEKIDIGAIYNYPCEDRMGLASGVFQPKEREFVIDIDLSDYNDVRTCCQAANICQRCWPFMAIAVKVLDTALREDFGFENIMWVYSGRRGIHCWVCDPRARALDNEGRTAVAEYLSCYTGGGGSGVDMHYPLHPTLRKAYEESLLPGFEALIVEEQRALSGEDEKAKALEAKMMEMISDHGLRESVKQKLNKLDHGTVKWDTLKETCEVFKRKKSGFASDPAKHAVEEIVFAHVFPRLDIAVSKHINHLLKSPFCIHPKTGRVCVPLDPALVEDFNPETVPTVATLYHELEAMSAKQRATEVEHTSIATGVRVFKQFVEGLEKIAAADASFIKIKNSAKKMTDEAIDFMSDATLLAV